MFSFRWCFYFFQKVSILIRFRSFNEGFLSFSHYDTTEKNHSLPPLILRLKNIFQVGLCPYCEFVLVMMNTYHLIVKIKFHTPLPPHTLFSIWKNVLLNPVILVGFPNIECFKRKNPFIKNSQFR